MDLFDKSALPHLRARLTKLKNTDVEIILKQSQLLKRMDGVSLWITAFFRDYRVIFRRSGIQELELLDIVAHDDLHKFLRTVE